MTNIVGVRFRNAGKIYYFDPENIEEIEITDEEKEERSNRWLTTILLKQNSKKHLTNRHRK